MTLEHNSKPAKNRWAWMWLAYTGFLIIQPIVLPSLRLWIGTLAALAIFFAVVFVYFRDPRPDQPSKLWVVAVIYALALVCFPWNQGASTFFIYAAAFLPFVLHDSRRVVWLIFLECVTIVAEGALFTIGGPKIGLYIGWPNTVFAIFLVVVIGGGNIFFAEQKRADCKLRAALESNLALAAVAERERIARDLHDVLGHTLSVIVLKAELAGRLIPLDAGRAANEIGDVERTAREALSEIREAIGGYRTRGFAAEIEAARLTLEAADVTLVSDKDALRGSALSAQEETALSLVLREAVTNIVRHARATTCTLRFVQEDGHRRFLVEDDGQHPIAHEGNGLRGMRERVEALGGHFHLERGVAKNRGTRLTIELPFIEAATS